MKAELPIDTASDDLREVRSRICDMMLAASAALVVPAVAASLYRIVSIGWKWEMTFHILGAVIVCGTYLYRKNISYPFRAGAIVGVFLFTGLVGFWQWGMITGANPMLLLAPAMATILFGKRVGITFAVVIVSVMILTAYSFVYGGRVFEITFDVSIAFLPSWITYTLTVILVVATSIAAISMSNHHLASALVKSRRHENELIELNKDLENQVVERTTELEIAKSKAEQQARTDVLTGLNNRRAFFEFAHTIDAQSRRYNHTYVIAMIDIDHFKSVNDEWGHETGDIALSVVGQVIFDILRETDIIGRIGGEEFAVILPETDIKESTLLAERLREAIEETTIETTIGEVNLTVSIGLAPFGDHNDTLEMIVAKADTALYLAKNAGRNRVMCHGESRELISSEIIKIKKP